ncbi:MAG: FlgB family protein [Pseudomonadota bacterium]
MFEELNLVRMASTMARNASVRHRIVAENTANADTPGYRARDVKRFAEYVNNGFTPRATRVGHIADRGFERASRAPEVFIDPSVDAGPNGNSVSLETEMIKSTETRGQHALALAIYRKAHELMRLGLGRGR